MLAACVPVLTPAPATATLTFTPEPTLTFTPAPTATITPTLAPSLPPEIAAGLQGQEYETRADGHIWVNVGGEWQDWFEQTPERQWQASDWKILEDAPMKLSWQPEKDWKNTENIIGAYSWPVATGEAAIEKQLVLNGQETTILVLPVVIRDMLDPSVHRHVFVPLRYTDKNGQILLETWFITGTPENGVEKTIADLLQEAKRGLQLELQMRIFYKNGKGFCGEGNLRCTLDADLFETQGLSLRNKGIRDGDILPAMVIADFIKGGRYLLP